MGVAVFRVVFLTMLVGVTFSGSLCRGTPARSRALSAMALPARVSIWAKVYWWPSWRLRMSDMGVS